MAKAGNTARWMLTGCLFLGVSVAAAPGNPPPTAAKMLSFQPKQEGVAISTPEADKQNDCKVEAVKGKTKGNGWVLKDGNGQILRRFFDTQETGRPDIWSYYKDGVEVYRETYVNTKDEPAQWHYRWFNAGGMKWGVDLNKDGKIDVWKAISAEEVSQEVLQALIANDFARLQALMITDAEIKSLELPAEMVSAIREKQKAAPAKFKETVGKLTGLNAKSSWVQFQTGTPTPQCLPAEQTGAKADLIRHPQGTILFTLGGKADNAQMKTEGVQTGEMILVGQAWRIVGAPEAGMSPAESKPENGIGVDSDNPKLIKLMEELSALDKQAPPGNGAEVAEHYQKRANLLDKIIAEVKPQQSDLWVRQLADSLGTVAQSNSKSAKDGMTRLLSLEDNLVKKMPGSNLTAYVAFREIQAEYSTKIATEKDFDKVQQHVAERLAKFVTDYPKADEALDALLQLGQVNEFLHEDVKAKNWYAAIVKNYADKPQAAKAAGAVKRLDLEGQPLKLAGPTLNDPNATFDIESLRGKLVVVYYWASWNKDCVGDFAKLKVLLDAEGSKGLELVCVNLDSTAQEAKSFLARSPAPGKHLHQPDGMEGKLATDYGIMMTPHIFLVGKDGKVLNRNAQLGSVEEEIRKQLGGK
jgi:hypothetical protein